MPDSKDQSGSGSLEDFLVEPAPWGKLDDESLLLDEDFIQKILKGEDDIELPEDFFLDGAPLEVPDDDGSDDELGEAEEEQLAEESIAQLNENEQRRESLYQQIKGMVMSQKIKLALKGGREARGLLMHDANRLIKRLVLRNPRITEDEVIIVARNKSEETEFLDFISKRKEWMKNYQVRLALVKNPKTPAPLSLRIVQTLLDRDLRQLAKSKSIPNVVNSAAKRVLFTRQEGRKA